MTIPITPKTGDKVGFRNKSGFTFVELLVVMTIIAVLMAVTLPYVTRSSHALQLQQETANLETALRLLIEQARQTQRTTRLVVDIRQQSYRLEQAASRQNDEFEPLAGALGQVRFLGRFCFLEELNGFQDEGEFLTLNFDPGQPWPHADMTLIGKEKTITLHIQGQTIGHQDTT